MLSIISAKTIRSPGPAKRPEKPTALIYRNEYVYQNTETFEKLEKEKDHLKNEYQLAKQAAAENAKLRKLNEDMAEIWHRAWFAWVRSIKYAAKEPVDKKAEKEFMGNLKKNIEKADFADLMNRKKQS